MSHIATWKILENLMLELKKKGVRIPANVINDLRSAKLMIKISESPDSTGFVSQKLDEYLGSIESYLVSEAQKNFSSEIVDLWLRHLEDAYVETFEAKPEENKFVTGVPRDQKWVRVEPTTNLTSQRIEQIAKESNLSVNEQNDGRLVVYGQPEGIKDFFKKMTANANKK